MIPPAFVWRRIRDIVMMVVAVRIAPDSTMIHAVPSRLLGMFEVFREPLRKIRMAMRDVALACVAIDIESHAMVQLLIAKNSCSVVAVTRCNRT